MILMGQLPVQHDMTIQDASCCICDRFIKVITVYSPVIDPLSEQPARSNSLGISEYTLGGYPLDTGGSPLASPISLCAMEKRVRESIIRRTSFP